VSENQSFFARNRNRIYGVILVIVVGVTFFNFYTNYSSIEKEDPFYREYCDTIQDIHISNEEYELHDHVLHQGDHIDICKIEVLKIIEDSKISFYIRLYIYDLDADIPKRSEYEIFFGNESFTFKREGSSISGVLSFFADKEDRWTNETSYKDDNVEFSLTKNLVGPDILEVLINDEDKEFDTDDELVVRTFGTNVNETKIYGFDFYPNMEGNFGYDELDNFCDLPDSNITYYLIVLSVFPAIIIGVSVIRYIRKQRNINKKREGVGK